MIRRKLLPAPPPPPEGMMFNPYDVRDGDFVSIKQFQSAMAATYDFFDSLTPEQRREYWGDDYFDAELNGRKRRVRGR